MPSLEEMNKCLCKVVLVNTPFILLMQSIQYSQILRSMEFSRMEPQCFDICEVKASWRVWNWGSFDNLGMSDFIRFINGNETGVNMSWGHGFWLFNFQSLHSDGGCGPRSSSALATWDPAGGHYWWMRPSSWSSGQVHGDQTGCTISVSVCKTKNYEGRIREGYREVLLVSLKEPS